MNRPAVLAFVLLAAAHAAQAQETEAVDSTVSAAAQPTYSTDSPPAKNRLDFDFRTEETRAWLNKDGDFQVGGWVKHNGIVCGTYRLGLRFGVGAPGCLNVEWLAEPVFVTSHLQCNNARVEHMGGDTSVELGTLIGKITCAERIIRCTGNCK